MRVDLGNADAIETVRGEHATTTRSIPGQQVTTLHLPDAMGSEAVVATVQNVLGYHFAPGARPAWLTCDDAALQGLLRERLDLHKNRPTNWGSR